MGPDLLTVYTIGHGRHPFAYFLELLQKYNIEFLCDVRAFPRSRWPQYNGLVLAELLSENRIGYEHLRETGGKNSPLPADRDRGIDRIIELAADVRTVMMCSESNPMTDHKVPRPKCHRVELLEPLLRAKGVSKVIHILPNGESMELG
jgi:uncharacterized protein (DUF488 family)